MIPDRGDCHRAMEAVDTVNCGNGRGGCWQDDDDNNAGVGVGIGIGVGPNSGGNNGDCMTSF